MDWHRCANNRRKRAVPSPMQPHLGDIPDMGPSPMVLHRMRQPYRVKVWPGVLIVCTIVLVMFIVAMARAKATDKPVEASEQQVRIDCTADALRFCKLAIPQGRDKIIACMQANKSKLQAKCSRHLW